VRSVKVRIRRKRTFGIFIGTSVICHALLASRSRRDSIENVRFSAPYATLEETDSLFEARIRKRTPIKRETLFRTGSHHEARWKSLGLTVSTCCTPLVAYFESVEKTVNLAFPEVVRKPTTSAAHRRGI